MVPIVDRYAIEFKNDITNLESRDLGGRTRRDAIHQGAMRMGHSKSGCGRVAEVVVELDPQKRPDHAPVRSTGGRPP